MMISYFLLGNGIGIALSALLLLWRHVAGLEPWDGTPFVTVLLALPLLSGIAARGATRRYWLVGSGAAVPLSIFAGAQNMMTKNPDSQDVPVLVLVLSTVSTFALPLVALGLGAVVHWAARRFRVAPGA